MMEPPTKKASEDGPRTNRRKGEAEGFDVCDGQKGRGGRVQS